MHGFCSFRKSCPSIVPSNDHFQRQLCLVEEDVRGPYDELLLHLVHNDTVEDIVFEESQFVVLLPLQELRCFHLLLSLVLLVVTLIAAKVFKSLQEVARGEVFLLIRACQVENVRIVVRDLIHVNLVDEVEFVDFDANDYSVLESCHVLNFTCSLRTHVVAFPQRGHVFESIGTRANFTLLKESLSLKIPLPSLLFLLLLILE